MGIEKRGEEEFRIVVMSRRRGGIGLGLIWGGSGDGEFEMERCFFHHC